MLRIGEQVLISFLLLLTTNWKCGSPAHSIPLSSRGNSRMPSWLVSASSEFFFTSVRISTTQKDLKIECLHFWRLRPSTITKHCSFCLMIAGVLTIVQVSSQNRFLEFITLNGCSVQAVSSIRTNSSRHTYRTFWEHLLQMLVLWCGISTMRLATAVMKTTVSLWWRMSLHGLDKSTFLNRLPQAIGIMEQVLAASTNSSCLTATSIPSTPIAT